MTAHTDQTFTELPCHLCGYDLRVHPRDGKCPECGASVAESRRLAAIPRRPAWRDSDPRWRRRVLVGVWILVFVPLMDALTMFGWATSVDVPNVFHFPVAHRLEESLFTYPSVYQPLIFCIGVVLLFSKERGRRRGRFDWTRRWGVGCSYIVLLLSAVEVLFIGALVLVGIAAVFLSMPPQYQPGITQWFVCVSTGYLRHGPYPGNKLGIVLVAFSSMTILLACAPLFDALRSSGPKRLAAILLAPLAGFALLHLAQAASIYLGISGVILPWQTSTTLSRYATYFWPEPLVKSIADLANGMTVWGLFSSAFIVEAIKWCSVLGTAVWLTIAQLAALRPRVPVSPAASP